MKTNIFKNKKMLLQKFLLVGIVFFALFIRLYNVKWDQGTHMHPDERFLTMLTADLKIPQSFGDYLNPAVSTLNPYNTKYNFYVYGTFPVTLNKLVSHAVKMDSYDGSLITGRVLSAIADTGTLIFVILIAGILARRYKLPWYFQHLAGFFYAITVLAIQHAHFFTVDSFATFFVTGSVYAALAFVTSAPRYKLLYILIMGIMMGLAGASKSSSIFAAPLLGFFIVYGIMFDQKNKQPAELHIRSLLYFGFFAIISGYAALRIGDPRLFAHASWFDVHINPKFIDNIKGLRDLTRPDSYFPPNIQWMSKKPILFPLQNIAVFGLGLPLFVTMLWGLYSMLLTKKKILIGVALWMIGFFLYQGSQFVTTTRYFYILYPFFAICAAWGWIDLSGRLKNVSQRFRYISAMVALIVIGFWPACFMAIYTRPHSRVSASEWIYNNVPAGSYLTSEYWDDALPLLLPNYPIGIYQGEQMPVFADDNEDKWRDMNRILSQADYYILSSNRAYGSLMPLQHRFPRITAFYQELFSGQGDFELVAEITSYPTIPFTNISFNDQWSDEAFTVYDHPRVLIYKKKAGK